MIARITNFANREDKVIGFDARGVNLITLDKIERNENYVSLYSKEDLEDLLSEFYLLLEKYPDALSDEIILKRYEKLKKYAKENNVSIANCYSYCDRKRIDYNQSYTCGIRLIPDDTNTTAIQIIKYDYFDNGFIYSKEQLNLALNYGKLYYNSLIMCDDCCMEILDRAALTYLEPKILTKHLQK